MGCGSLYLWTMISYALHGPNTTWGTVPAQGPKAWVCSTLWHLLGGESHATIPVFIVTLFLISNFVFFFLILCVRIFSFL